jgi:raffinose/stachyose/melibiose transport system substrate-binding protein
MTNPFSRRTAFLGGASLILLSAGCSQANQTGAAASAGGDALAKKIEIGVLPAEGTSSMKFIQDIGDSITKEHPGAKFTYTFANSKARPVMEQRWRSKNAPDMDYYVFNAQVPKSWEFQDQLLDLTPYMAEQVPSGGTWGDSFLEGTKAVTVKDGKQYGVVTDGHLLAVFYNKKIFERLGLSAPKTWDDFIKVGQALKAGGVAPVAVTGMYEPYMGMWVDELFMREVGYKRAYDAAYSGDYTDAGFLKAAEKVQDMRDRGFLMQGFKGIDFTPTQIEFFQGKAGMILMGTWLSSEMKDSIPPDFQLAVTSFPTVDGASGDQDAALAHNNILAINKNTQAKELAIEFAKRFTSKDVQTRRAQEVATVSQVKGVPVPKGVEGLEQVLTSAKKLNVRYYGLEYAPDRQTAYYREVAKLFFGEYNAAQFIQALSTAMKRIPK